LVLFGISRFHVVLVTLVFRNSQDFAPEIPKLTLEFPGG